MLLNKRVVFLLGLIFLSLSALFAKDDLPDPMRPYRLVNDFAEVFTPSETNSLEAKLRAFHDSTSNQIYVVTVNTLNGDAPYSYAARLGNKWAIGQKGKDNGILILIKPKNEDGRGEVFIAPGYGLEGTFNDAFVGRIIDNYMLPYLKENNYYMATDEAIGVISARISGDETLPNEPMANGGEEFSLADQLIAAVLVFGFIFCLIKFPRFRTFMLLLLMAASRGGGKGGGGSSGGKGFGGGGGGRFGGGGAGRSW